MKTIKSLFWTAVVALTVVISASADGTTTNIVITDLTNEAERDSFLTNTVAATAYWRAGGTGIEMFADDGTTSDSESGFFWTDEVGYGFELNYDNNTGLLDMKMTFGIQEFVVTVSPNTWFDTILLSVENNGFFVDGVTLSGNSIGGTGFRDLSAPAQFDWDGLRIEFPDNGSGNVASFNVSGNFTPSWQFGYGGDDFRGEVYLVQQGNLTNSVPEPEVIPQSTSGNITPVSDGVVEVSWEVDECPNFTWYLQRCTNLLSGVWTDVYEVFPTNGSVVAEIVIDDSPCGLFRVECRPNP